MYLVEEVRKKAEGVVGVSLSSYTYLCRRHIYLDALKRYGSKRCPLSFNAFRLAKYKHFYTTDLSS